MPSLEPLSILPLRSNAVAMRNIDCT